MEPEGTFRKAEAAPRCRLMSEYQLAAEGTQSWRGKYALLGSDFRSFDLKSVLLAPSLPLNWASASPL